MKKRENNKKPDELYELTEQLALVNKKLKESEAIKSHFLSNIRNEIINPFASIIGLAENVLSLEKGDWKRVRTIAKMIYNEAFDLDFQLGNIFAAATIEAGDYSLEIIDVDINILVKNVIDSYMFKADKKQVEINLMNEIKFKDERGSCFKTDPGKIRLVLSNLIDNAVKFSNNKSKVVVRAWLEGETLNISVRDFGAGIDEANREIIYDRFKRLDSTISSIQGGHGLGLSVTKALIDQLNGKIEITSLEKLGAIFTISIPESQMEMADDFSAIGKESLF